MADQHTAGSALAHKVEHVAKQCLVGVAVEAYLAHFGEEREVDIAAGVFLVVPHELAEPAVMFAGEVGAAVVLVDERHGGPHPVGGEAAEHLSLIHI